MLNPLNIKKFLIYEQKSNIKFYTYIITYFDKFVKSFY